MNKYFLEDLKEETGLTIPESITKLTSLDFRLQLYIAMKLWRIEQLLSNQNE